MSWPADAYVGQEIVCLGTRYFRSDAAKYGIVHPVKGKVYTIRDIEVTSRAMGFRLRELHNAFFNFSNGYGEPFFSSDCFRPVQKFKNDISIFTEILDKVNQKETADVLG